MPGTDAGREVPSAQYLLPLPLTPYLCTPHLPLLASPQVEKSLPPKNERIVRVEMTPLQKQYYKVGGKQ